MKLVQLHDTVFADRVVETNGKEDEEGSVLKQEVNNWI